MKRRGRGFKSAGAHASSVTHTHRPILTQYLHTDNDGMVTNEVYDRIDSSATKEGDTGKAARCAFGPATLAKTALTRVP